MKHKQRLATASTTAHHGYVIEIEPAERIRTEKLRERQAARKVEFDWMLNRFQGRRSMKMTDAPAQQARAEQMVSSQARVSGSSIMLVCLSVCLRHYFVRTPPFVRGCWIYTGFMGVGGCNMEK